MPVKEKTAAPDDQNPRARAKRVTFPGDSAEDLKLRQKLERDEAEREAKRRAAVSKANAEATDTDAKE